MVDKSVYCVMQCYVPVACIWVSHHTSCFLHWLHFSVSFLKVLGMIKSVSNFIHKTNWILNMGRIKSECLVCYMVYRTISPNYDAVYRSIVFVFVFWKPLIKLCILVSHRDFRKPWQNIIIISKIKQCFLFISRGNPYTHYQRALISNAATSALRLHQRLPNFQFSRVFMTQLFAEDSCHYLMYSIIFLNSYPITSILSVCF